MKLLLLSLSLTSGAAAQSNGPWAITSSTLDGGGAASTGGVWKITGTLAQADATVGHSTGAPWSAQGGFWPGVVAVPGGPVLTITLASPNSATVSWSASAIGYRLQSSPDLRTWTTQGSIITSASSLSWPTAFTSGARSFFRLVRP
jgi:hypothetical protein